MPSALFLPPSPSALLPRAGSPCAGLFYSDHALWFPAGSGYREGSAAAPRSKPMLPVFCRARDDHMGGLCPIGMTKTFRRRHLPKRSYGVICGSLSRSDRFRNTRNLCVMAGLDPAIHAASASFAVVPNLVNIISALITWFSVLVDGRFKPGHDEKPKGRRCAVTSNS